MTKERHLNAKRSTIRMGRKEVEVKYAYISVWPVGILPLPRAARGAWFSPRVQPDSDAKL